MKAIASLARHLFDRFTADDSPASYYFMCGVATLIVGDAAALYLYEATMLLRCIGTGLIHAVSLIIH
jgi:hypothetical protein